MTVPQNDHTREKIAALRSQDSETPTTRLRRNAKCSGSCGYDVCVVPEKLIFLHYIIDPQPVPGELVSGIFALSTPVALFFNMKK